MDIGEMKQRIEFMVEENVSDGQGGYDTTLVSKGSTWAKVTNMATAAVMAMIFFV